ncbi:hypothetical protein ADT27_00775 [Xanthomonas oryzae]|uniref:hypothetical protein n=1 Tax=Xanthomonas oryzae TaxID=347 RepID=UPI0006AC5FF8|nr:hypothetical protein [Xanthomonas oryzae]KOR54415.1 hypothetical protein ADT27_00775 [Xanthomonas oryzae]
MKTKLSLNLSEDQAELIREMVRLRRISVAWEIDRWQRKLHKAGHNYYQFKEAAKVSAWYEQQAKDLAELTEMLQTGENT